MDSLTVDVEAGHNYWAVAILDTLNTAGTLVWQPIAPSTECDGTRLLSSTGLAELRFGIPRAHALDSTVEQDRPVLGHHISAGLPGQDS